MNSRWPGGDIWLATRNNYETVTQPLQGTVQSPSLGSFLSWQNFLSLKQLDLSVQSQGNKWASCSRSSHSTTATIYVDSFLLFIWIFISSGSRKCLLHWFVITYVKAVGTVPQKHLEETTRHEAMDSLWQRGQRVGCQSLRSPFFPGKLPREIRNNTKVGGPHPWEWEALPDHLYMDY